MLLHSRFAQKWPKNGQFFFHRGLLPNGSPKHQVKTEQKESESKEETTTSVKQEERTPEPDSEDSLTAERVAEMIHRLSGIQGHGVSAHVQPETREEATPPQIAPRERASVSEDSREPGYGRYASQGARRARGRCRSPDPFLFSDTVFLEHDSEASAARDDPMQQLQSRLSVWSTILRH